MANRVRRFGDNLNNHQLNHQVKTLPTKIASNVGLEDQENRIFHPTSGKDGKSFHFQVYCDESEKSSSKVSAARSPTMTSSEHEEQMLVDNMEAYKKHLHSILVDSSEPSCIEASNDKENSLIADESMVVEQVSHSLIEQSSVLNDSSVLEHSEISLLQNCTERDVFYEYADSIRLYMLKKERHYMPDPLYMNQQANINPKMRSILIDWMVDVSEEYHMKDETLFLAINYIDRFLSKASITRQEFQLLGTTALFVASKYEEIYPPELKDFVFVTDEYYTKAQILQSERLLLTALEFNVSPPTFNYFLEKALSELDLSKEVVCLSKYICFLAALEVSPFLKYYPSELAIASIMVATKRLGISDQLPQDFFNQTVEYERSLGDAGDVQQLVYDRNTLCEELESLLQAAKSHPQQAIQRKFSSSKYCGAAYL